MNVYVFFVFLAKVHL